MHLATNCRGRSRVPPVPPEAFGDVVGRGLTVTSGCRHPELPTRSRGLPFGTCWGVIGSVGGAVFIYGSHLSDSFLAFSDLIVN